MLQVRLFRRSYYYYKGLEYIIEIDIVHVHVYISNTIENVGEYASTQHECNRREDPTWAQLMDEPPSV